jgi:hypothetical protein
MLRVQIDPRAIAELDNLLAAFPREGRLAAQRAVRKTLAYVRTHGRRALSQATDVPLKALRLRKRVAVKTAFTGNRLAGIAWFGTLPIKAAALGPPRQTKTGAKVRGHVFPGAFVATMPTGYRGVFRRSGADRLPIREETVPLDTAEAAVAAVFERAPERLRTTFLQEFRWIVRGGARAGARA